MPLTADDFVRERTGTDTVADTTSEVRLYDDAEPSGTVAGNTVLVFVSSGVPFVTPSNGFVLDKSIGSVLLVYRKSEVAADEKAWTFTTAANVTQSWYAVELSNIDPVEPLDASATSSAGVGVSNGGTLSTGTTQLNAGLNTVVFAAFKAGQPGGSVESWSGYTPAEFEEVADVGGSGTGQLGVARKFIDGSTGTFSCTATLATTQSFATCNALVVAYRSADSPIVAPLAMLAGFDWGTHGGMNSHNGVTNMMGTALTQTIGTWGTNYLIQAASARNSDYGLRVVQSAAAGQVRVGDLNTKTGSFGFDVRVVSATGTVVVAEVTDQGSSSVKAQLLYDSSTSQFGVRCGTTGTVSWQSGTTAINTWVLIDLRLKISTTTWHADWRVETGTDTYTDQAAAELTGQSAGTVFYTLGLGRNGSQTMTADFDNVILSRYYVAYPLGPHQIRLLTVDPAGTPAVSGTTTNFSVFTANGTLAAWNAANARNAVDEVPPTISASADGVVQTATAASDYMEFPMATYTASGTETIVGVRMMAPLWSGTGAGAGDLAIRGYDGTTETVLATASQITPGSPTAISSTVPVWRCAMWQSPNGWTQAELDAAALRVGFSGDATPDMGVHAVYLEVAIGPVRVARLGDVEGGAFAVDVRSNPNSAAYVSLLASVPADRGMNWNYSVSGTPQNPAYIPAGSGAVEVVTGAAAFGDISDVQLYPDATP